MKKYLAILLAIVMMTGAALCDGISSIRDQVNGAPPTDSAEAPSDQPDDPQSGLPAGSDDDRGVNELASFDHAKSQPSAMSVVLAAPSVQLSFDGFSVMARPTDFLDVVGTIDGSFKLAAKNQVKLMHVFSLYPYADGSVRFSGYHLPEYRLQVKANGGKSFNNRFFNIWKDELERSIPGIQIVNKCENDWQYTVDKSDVVTARLVLLVDMPDLGTQQLECHVKVFNQKKSAFVFSVIGSSTVDWPAMDAYLNQIVIR